MLRLSSAGIALLTLVAGTALAGQASAQAVEHNTPSVPKGQAVLTAAPNLVAANQDATPLAEHLLALTLLNPEEAIRPHVARGVDMAGSPRLAGDPRSIKALGKYLGRPISKKLIAEIQATIARRYRALGYPFVSLSTPPQEVSNGALQIRVVEFKAGEVAVKGATNAAAAKDLGKAVHQKAGQDIDAHVLDEDLTWLNHYPFRQVKAAFTPGTDLGVTDLTLDVSQEKPWQVYAGYDNNGSASTGQDRYLLGGSIGNVFGHDSVLSYQGTRSQVSSKPAYTSDALAYVLPFGQHGQIEVNVDRVESVETVAPFSVDLQDIDASFGYRHALEHAGLSGLSDGRFGVEFKHEVGKTSFLGTQVFDADYDVYDLYVGVHHIETDALGSSELDIVTHLAPGNISHANSNAVAVAYSQGRLKNSAYLYTGVTLDRTTTITRSLELDTAFIGQIAGDPLPRSEQVGLGGASLVRGFTLDDGSFDSAAVLRNEVHFNALNAGAAHIQPFLFVDLGYGKDNYTKMSKTLSSAGAGAAVYVTRHANLNVSLAQTLATGAVTKRGKTVLNLSLVSTF